MATSSPGLDMGKPSRFAKRRTMTYGLTACCGASAKGSMDVVCCRNCYEEIDPMVDILDERDIAFRVNN